MNSCLREMATFLQLSLTVSSTVRAPTTQISLPLDIKWSTVVWKFKNKWLWSVMIQNIITAMKYKLWHFFGFEVFYLEILSIHGSKLHGFRFWQLTSYSQTRTLLFYTSRCCFMPTAALASGRRVSTETLTFSRCWHESSICMSSWQDHPSVCLFVWPQSATLCPCVVHPCLFIVLLVECCNLPPKPSHRFGWKPCCWPSEARCCRHPLMKKAVICSHIPMCLNVCM